MTTQTAPAEAASRAPSGPWRFAAPIAALFGLAGGVAFGGPVLDFVGHVWERFLLPAYLEIQSSGIPLCG